MGEDKNKPETPKTFWQIVADPSHPFWKFCYVALIVPCMMVTVNSFDADELTILGKWIASAGGLAGILKLAQGWVNKT